MKEIAGPDIDRLYETLNREAEGGGYHLNPDVEFTKDLARGLLVNVDRYGYKACPCRLADGVKEKDLDIICPCDYRDPDLDEYGTCFCGLYVTSAVIKGEVPLSTIPERRPSTGQRIKPSAPPTAGAAGPSLPGQTRLAWPVWRCKVCGYLCARDQPPEVCPVCKVKRERFERFM